MKWRLPSIGNTKLTDNLKMIYRELQRVRDYKEYSVESRPEFILKDKKAILERMRPNLENVLKEYNQEITRYEFELKKHSHGDLTKSSSNSHLTAVIEYNSALLFAGMNPSFKQIEAVVYTAFLEKRFEFVHSLFKLLIPAFTNPEDPKLKQIEGLQEEFLSMSGYTEAMGKKKTASEYADETQHFIDLTLDVPKFESEVSLIINTEAQMSYADLKSGKTA